jgi:hypothetical protein
LPSDKRLEVLKNRAKEALTAAGEERTRLGYDGLVKFKVDGLLDQESIQMAVEDYREFLAGVARTPARAQRQCTARPGRVKMGRLSDVVR